MSHESTPSIWVHQISADISNKVLPKTWNPMVFISLIFTHHFPVFFPNFLKMLHLSFYATAMKVKTVLLYSLVSYLSSDPLPWSNILYDEVSAFILPLRRGGDSFLKKIFLTIFIYSFYLLRYFFSFLPSSLKLWHTSYLSSPPPIGTVPSNCHVAQAHLTQLLFIMFST